MLRSSRPALTVLALGLLALGLLALAGAACGGGESDPFAKYRGFQVEPPFEKPVQALTDTDGRRFDIAAETEGSITLLYVGYTFCPDVCPTHLFELSRALARVDAKVRNQVTTVFVTSDPERDTAAVLRRYLDNFDPGFIGLRGEMDELSQFLADLRMPPPEKTDLGGGYYSVSHAAFIIAYSKDGLGHLIYPGGMTAEDWINDLPGLVKEEWK